MNAILFFSEKFKNLFVAFQSADKQTYPSLLLPNILCADSEMQNISQLTDLVWCRNECVGFFPLDTPNDRKKMG